MAMLQGTIYFCIAEAFFNSEKAAKGSRLTSTDFQRVDGTSSTMHVSARA
jgi:hypothetical protein